MLWSSALKVFSSTGRDDGSIAGFIDRWIYVFMTLLFLGLVLAGFIPDSIEKVAAVQSGQRPPFPAILHIHAIVMGLWTLALVAQAALMVTHNAEIHKRFGAVLMGLATLVVIVAFVLVPVMRLQNVESILQAPPELVASLKAKFAVKLNILLVQIRHVSVFFSATLLGLVFRAKDSGAHKRLMIMGTAALIGAATDRIGWLPSSLPGNPATNLLWPIVALAPMFLWDIYRLRKIHTAYIVYFSIVVVAEIPIYLLWNTPAWHKLALQILGLSGVLT